MKLWGVEGGGRVRLDGEGWGVGCRVVLIYMYTNLHSDLVLSTRQILVRGHPLPHVDAARAQHGLHQEQVRDGVAHRLIRHVYKVQE